MATDDRTQQDAQRENQESTRPDAGREPATPRAPSGNEIPLEARNTDGQGTGGVGVDGGGYGPVPGSDATG